MSDNKGITLFKKLAVWIIPLSFITAGILAISDSKASLLATMLIMLSGMMFSPPCKNICEKKFQKHTSVLLRSVSFVFLLALAINIDSNKTPQEFKSDEHKKMYFAMLEEDFLGSIENNTTILSADQWFDILKIKGFVRAKDLLNDFSKNEIAANRKYEGSWLIIGEVHSIDNSLGTAVVGLDDKSSLSSFGAHLKNKSRAANYEIGDMIIVHCKNISETLSVISGFNCSDYRDWKHAAFERAQKDLPEAPLNNETPLSFKDYMYKSIEAINTLPQNSSCFESLKSDTCNQEFERAIKFVEDKDKHKLNQAL